MLLHLLELLPTLGPRAGPRPGRGRRAAGRAARAARAYGVPSVKAAWYGEVRRAGAVGRQGLLARAERRLRAGRAGPPAAAAGRPAGDLRRRRRRLRHPPQGPARRARPLGGQPGRGRGAAAGGRHRPVHPRRAALGHRLRPAGRDRPGGAVSAAAVPGRRRPRGRRRRSTCTSPSGRCGRTASTSCARSTSPSRCSTRSPRGPGDGLALSVTGRARGRRRGGRRPHRPPQPRLAGRGAAGRSTPACPPTPTLDVAKSIPAAAGLAGGSADAAAALVALDALWGTRAGRDDLAALAAQLGSDVPFSLLGGVALGSGRGEQLSPVLARTPVGLGARHRGGGAVHARRSTRELDRLRAAGRVPDGTELAAGGAGDRRAPQRARRPRWPPRSSTTCRRPRWRCAPSCGGRCRGDRRGRRRRRWSAAPGRRSPPWPTTSRRRCGWPRRWPARASSARCAPCTGPVPGRPTGRLTRVRPRWRPGASSTRPGSRVEVGQPVVGQVHQVRGHLVLAGRPVVQPPLPDQRHHADQRLAVELGELRVVAAGVELVGRGCARPCGRPRRSARRTCPRRW